MEIQSLLVNLGYNINVSEQILEEGPPNSNFIDVIAWLNCELCKLCELESIINCSTNVGDEDTLSFVVEVSSLLRELSCPYSSLMKVNMHERFIHLEDKKLLIIYLCTELEVAKIISFKKPKQKYTPVKIELEESNIAKKLKEVLISLQFPKPPETVTVPQMFGVIEKKLNQLSQPSVPKEKVGKLLFTECLTEKQWLQLQYLYKEMYQEYKVRKELLLSRLEVTIKSFLWSDRLTGKYENIMNIYRKYRKGISLEPMVKISDILAANRNLTFIEKVSAASVRKNTMSAVNNVAIGVVPDRGGRPEEQFPPPEIPIWQKNSLASSKHSGFSSNLSSSTKKHNSRENIRNNFSGYASCEYTKTHVTMNYTSKEDNIFKKNKGFKKSPKPFVSTLYQPGWHQHQIVPYDFDKVPSSGNNYQEYGMKDGVSPVNRRNNYQARGAYRGPRSHYGYPGRNSRS